MSGKRYPEEFKTEAVKQVVDRGYSVASVATRLDITTHSLYAWIKKYGPDSSTNKEQSDAQAEIRRLQKELKRVTDERDILKKAAVDSICQCNTPFNYLFRCFELNRPGFPGECFICELRLPDHRFRWKHNKLFLLLPEEYGPAFPAIVDCYTSPPT
ncbi:transposase family protein [Escherichia coli P0299438.10]|nr:transposase family protein [Escherichia coli 201600.1]ENB84287.1 transposase family protein [Escherichia coli P0299438.10]END07091.1 transposase family protein [Escherichia coli P0302308.3]ENE37414.1 transposase family protein [Escherichia coli P0302293.8]ENE46393.1 transposase family protein [Escherichia coli P0302293.9]WNT91004.1 hypothetical protein QMY53_05046 [Escherichia coli TW14425]